MKERFEEMANMLDGLQRLEVGINVLHGDEAADVALYMEFESRGATRRTPCTPLTRRWSRSSARCGRRGA